MWIYLRVSDKKQRWLTPLGGSTHSTPWANIITRPGSMIISSAMWRFSQAMTITACFPAKTLQFGSVRTVKVLHSWTNAHRCKPLHTQGRRKQQPVIMPTVWQISETYLIPVSIKMHIFQCLWRGSPIMDDNSGEEWSSTQGDRSIVHCQEPIVLCCPARMKKLCP